MSTREAKTASVSSLIAIEALLLLIALSGIRFTSIALARPHGSIFLYVLAGMFFGAIAYGLALLIFRRVHSYSASLRDLISKVRSSVAHFGLAAVFIISISAAIGEEALFRVFAQSWIDQFTPTWVAILTASLLFAAAHAISWVYFAITFVLGLLIGAAFAYTESVALAISWHFSYDFLSLLVLTKFPNLLFLAVNDGESSAPQSNGKS